MCVCMLCVSVFGVCVFCFFVFLGGVGCGGGRGAVS